MAKYIPKYCFSVRKVKFVIGFKKKILIYLDPFVEAITFNSFGCLPFFLIIVFTCCLHVMTYPF